VLCVHFAAADSTDFLLVLSEEKKPSRLRRFISLIYVHPAGTTSKTLWPLHLCELCVHFAAADYTDLLLVLSEEKNLSRLRRFISLIYVRPADTTSKTLWPLRLCELCVHFCNFAAA
jgi:uncharacterized membrane protein YwaF